MKSSFIKKILQLIYAILMSFFPKQSSTTKVKDFIDWEDDISISTVKEVRFENGGIGVVPGSFSDIFYTNDSSEISYYISILSFEVKRMSRDEMMVGGSFKKITYLLNNGSRREIQFSNNMLDWVSANYNITSTIKAPENYYESRHSFVSPLDEITIHSYSNDSYSYLYTQVKDLEFVEWPSDVAYIAVAPSFYVSQTYFFDGKLEIYSADRIVFGEPRTMYQIKSEINFSCLF